MLIITVDKGDIEKSLKKFKSKEEFASYSERYLKKLAEKFKRKINKMKYLNLQDK